MAKGSKLGGMKNAGAYPGSGSRGEQRCLSCKRRIAWGERCESCKREAGRTPTPQATMTRTLLRPCLDCGKAVRGKPRCRDCQANHDRAKASKRPDMRTHAETERRRRLVATHRAKVGDWCPGLEDHPAHPCADLVADHVVEVAAGGPEAGPLRVLCRSENSRRSARILSRVLGPDPSPAEPPITHRDDDPGPVAA